MFWICIPLLLFGLLFIHIHCIMLRLAWPCLACQVCYGSHRWWVAGCWNIQSMRVFPSVLVCFVAVGFGGVYIGKAKRVRKGPLMMGGWLCTCVPVATLHLENCPWTVGACPDYNMI